MHGPFSFLLRVPDLHGRLQVMSLSRYYSSNPLCKRLIYTIFYIYTNLNYLKLFEYLLEEGNGALDFAFA